MTLRPNYSLIGVHFILMINVVKNKSHSLLFIKQIFVAFTSNLIDSIYLIDNIGFYRWVTNFEKEFIWKNDENNRWKTQNGDEKKFPYQKMNNFADIFSGIWSDLAPFDSQLFLLVQCLCVWYSLGSQNNWKNTRGNGEEPFCLKKSDKLL